MKKERKKERQKERKKEGQKERNSTGRQTRAPNQFTRTGAETYSRERKPLTPIKRKSSTNTKITTEIINTIITRSMTT